MSKSVVQAEHFYVMFGIANTFAPAELTAARRRLAAAFHPDKGGDAQEMAIINDAHATLEDPERHRLYRAQLRSSYPVQCRACRGEGQVYKSKGFRGRESRLCTVCGGAGLTTKELR